MLGKMFVKSYLDKEFDKGDYVEATRFFKNEENWINKNFTYIVNAWLNQEDCTLKVKMEHIEKANEDLQLTMRIISRLEDMEWEECKMHYGYKS